MVCFSFPAPDGAHHHSTPLHSQEHWGPGREGAPWGHPTQLVEAGVSALCQIHSLALTVSQLEGSCLSQRLTRRRITSGRFLTSHIPGEKDGQRGNDKASIRWHLNSLPPRPTTVASWQWQPAASSPGGRACPATSTGHIYVSASVAGPGRGQRGVCHSGPYCGGEGGVPRLREGRALTCDRELSHFCPAVSKTVMPGSQGYCRVLAAPPRYPALLPAPPGTSVLLALADENWCACTVLWVVFLKHECYHVTLP